VLDAVLELVQRRDEDGEAAGEVRRPHAAEDRDQRVDRGRQHVPLEEAADARAGVAAAADPVGELEEAAHDRLLQRADRAWGPPAQFSAFYCIGKARRSLVITGDWAVITEESPEAKLFHWARASPRGAPAEGKAPEISIWPSSCLAEKTSGTSSASFATCS
jgi:hypothetical protein